MMTLHGEVQFDGQTVWCHKGAYTVGRFGKGGVDIHTADATGCIDCTHEKPTQDDWYRFVAGMKEHHEIEVPPCTKPTWV